MLLLGALSATVPAVSRAALFQPLDGDKIKSALSGPVTSFAVSDLWFAPGNAKLILAVAVTRPGGSRCELVIQERKTGNVRPVTLDGKPLGCPEHHQGRWMGPSQFIATGKLTGEAVENDSVALDSGKATRLPNQSSIVANLEKAAIRSDDALQDASAAAPSGGHPDVTVACQATGYLQCLFSPKQGGAGFPLQVPYHRDAGLREYVLHPTLPWVITVVEHALHLHSLRERGAPVASFIFSGRHLKNVIWSAAGDLAIIAEEDVHLVSDRELFKRSSFMSATGQYCPRDQTIDLHLGDPLPIVDQVEGLGAGGWSTNPAMPDEFSCSVKMYRDWSKLLQPETLPWMEAHAWMSSPRDLWIDVSKGSGDEKPRWKSGGKSWIHDDHLEIWLSEPGSCLGPDSKLLQWGIRISDAKVDRGAGDPQQPLNVEVVDFTQRTIEPIFAKRGHLRRRFHVLLPFDAFGISVASSQGDGKSRQLVLRGNTFAVRKDPRNLTHLTRSLSLSDRPTCRLEGQRFVTSPDAVVGKLWMIAREPFAD